MPRLKFLRRNWSKASRLGRKRKNKQVWRSPKGRHSKTRGERKGYPAIVKIGYKQDASTSGLIENKIPMLVNNIKELGRLGKNQIAVLGNIGMKKKLEIAKFAKEKKIEISNLNVEKLLNKAEKIKKYKAEQKKTTLTKKETKAEEKKEVKKRKRKLKKKRKWRKKSKMDLKKKKALAVRALGVGAKRIKFLEPRLEEIKEALTKQDIRDLYKDGAIVIKNISGRKTSTKKKKKKKRRKCQKKS